jgi:hypothetical protein
MKIKLLILLAFLSTTATANELSVIKDKDSISVRKQSDLSSVAKAGIHYTYLSSPAIQGGGVGISVTPGSNLAFGVYAGVDLAVTAMAIVKNKEPDAGLLYDISPTLQYTLSFIHVGVMYDMRYAHKAHILNTGLQDLQGNKTRIYLGLSF